MTTPLKIRILLADDHTVVRRGIRMVLEAAPDLELGMRDRVQLTRYAIRRGLVEP